MRREEGSCFRQFMRLGAFLLKLQKRAEKCAKNEGSSGYVDENTEIEGTDPVTDCPEPVAADAPSTQSEVEKAESEVRSPRSEAGVEASEVETAESEFKKAESEVRSPRSEVGVEASEVETAESDAESALYEVESEGPPEVDHAAA
jgi:hypothetical protein